MQCGGGGNLCPSIVSSETSIPLGHPFVYTEAAGFTPGRGGGGGGWGLRNCRPCARLTRLPRSQ